MNLPAAGAYRYIINGINSLAFFRFNMVGTFSHINRIRTIFISLCLIQRSVGNIFADNRNAGNRSL